LLLIALVLAGLLVALAAWECVMLYLGYQFPGNGVDRLLDDYRLPQHPPFGRGGYVPMLSRLPRIVWRHCFAVFAYCFVGLSVARRETASFALAVGLSLLAWRTLGWWIWPIVDESGVVNSARVFEQFSTFASHPRWWVVSHMGRALTELVLSGALVAVLARLMASDDGGSFTPLRYRWSLLGSAVAFAFGFGVHFQSVARWLSSQEDGDFLDPVAMFDFMMLDVLPMLLCAVTFIGIMHLRTWSLLTGILACISALVVPAVLPLVSHAYVDADYLLPPFANWALLVALAPLAWTFLDALRSGRDLTFEPAPSPGSNR